MKCPLCANPVTHVTNTYSGEATICRRRKCQHRRAEAVDQEGEGGELDSGSPSAYQRSSSRRNLTWRSTSLRLSSFSDTSACHRSISADAIDSK